MPTPPLVYGSKGINGGRRTIVKENAKKGADALKFLALRSDEGCAGENKETGADLPATMPSWMARWNVLQSAQADWTSMEHWYGLPEALFTDHGPVVSAELQLCQ